MPKWWADVLTMQKVPLQEQISAEEVKRRTTNDTMGSGDLQWTAIETGWTGV